MISEPESLSSRRAAVLTISTSRADGEGVDRGGPALTHLAEDLGLTVAVHETIPDDRELIAERLRQLADGAAVCLILTTGGTGFSPSDVTPEATLAVIDRQAPGIAEAMRAASRGHTKHWMLSRAVAGIRGGALIINFPGNPRSIAEIGEHLAPALPHAIRLLAGSDDEH